VALDPPSVSRILLVRHAEAAERARWHGDDRARPLTASGRAQAARLARSLQDQPISRVLSSAYLRCVETVSPLAARRGLRPELVGWLEEGADGAAALDRLSGLGDAIACTHGDVVSGVLLELAERGVGLGPSPRMQKGSTWVLDVEGGRVSAARYLPPPR
jgi:phosphohistidine phosphatase SixA